MVVYDFISQAVSKYVLRLLPACTEPECQAELSEHLCGPMCVPV